MRPPSGGVRANRKAQSAASSVSKLPSEESASALRASRCAIAFGRDVPRAAPHHSRGGGTVRLTPGVRCGANSAEQSDTLRLQRELCAPKRCDVKCRLLCTQRQTTSGTPTIGKLSQNIFRSSGGACVAGQLVLVIFSANIRQILIVFNGNLNNRAF